MPTALFVISIYNYHREVQPVVEEFAANGWQVVTVIGWLGDTADDAADAYAKLGCRVERLPPGIAYGQSATATAKKVSSAPAKHPSLPLRLARGLRAYQRQRSMKAVVTRIVDNQQPDIMMFGPFHSCGMFDNAFAALGRRRGLKIFCYPVSAYHGTIGAIKARFANLAQGMLPAVLRSDYDRLNKWLARVFPQWTRTLDGATIFLWDPLHMAASRANGLLEKDCWQKPAPIFDATFVYNEFSSALLRESGYPSDTVVVVGVPLMDQVIRRAADASSCAQVRAHLHLEPGAPFLLFNVEPSAEHHYADWDTHWQRFEALLSMVTKAGLPVVLSLHPLCRLENYIFAEERYGVRISRDYKIHDLYPLCRAVVSFPCSTNIFAGLFSKPLVMYDFQRQAHPQSDRVDEFRLPDALVGHDVAEIAEHLAATLAAPMPEIGETPAAFACAAIRRHVESRLDPRSRAKVDN